MAAAGAAAVGFAAWWATGLRPFTTTVYVAVGVPTVALAVIVASVGPAGRHQPTQRRGEAGPVLRSFLPWVVLGALGAGLEGLGLLLGGRSASVPTLSTVVDHCLAWHGLRFVLFCGWLAVGWVPLLRSVGGGSGGA